MIICGKFPRLVRAVAGFALITLLVPAYAQNPTSQPIQPEKTVNGHAAGTFDVNLTPQPSEGGDPAVGRMLLSKQFHGDLTGSSAGQMLSAGSPAKGTGGYVAMEKVSVTLAGRIGAFVLQHSGTMDHGKLELNIRVVPDSGTGELAGITGTMNIRIAEDGKHFYELDYTLPAGQ